MPRFSPKRALETLPGCIPEKICTLRLGFALTRSAIWSTFDRIPPVTSVLVDPWIQPRSLLSDRFVIRDMNSFRFGYSLQTPSSLPANRIRFGLRVLVRCTNSCSVERMVADLISSNTTSPKITGRSLFLIVILIGSIFQDRILVSLAMMEAAGGKGIPSMLASRSESITSPFSRAAWYRISLTPTQNSLIASGWIASWLRAPEVNLYFSAAA